MKSTTRTDFSGLLSTAQIDAMVEEWMAEDHPSFDVGGMVVGDAEKQARLFMKSPGVFAGKPFFEAVIRNIGCRIEWMDHTGVEAEAKEQLEGTCFPDASGDNKICLAIVSGPVQNILRGERTALNIISRCSGVATASRHAVKIAKQIQQQQNATNNLMIAGTRKTTPGAFRLVEKYGLLVGGAATHRMDLSQMVMLKDNHIWACGGSITHAVHKAKQASGFSSKIDVECQNLEEAVEAAEAGADIVMLDNFEPSQLKKDAETLKNKFPHVLIEASGGITIDNMADYISQHVDIISQGKLTHGYECIDFSLKIVQ